MLELRKKFKKKKPVFVRKDAHNKARVPFKWRQPRGKHSPTREKKKGRPKLVSIGYGSPKIIKYLHPSGLQPISIQTKKQLYNLDPKTQGIILSKSTGNKKRIELIRLALEKNTSILNFKNPQEYLEKLEAEFKAKKELKKRKLTEKEKKELEKKKKAEEKEEEEKREVEEKKEEKTPEEILKEKRGEEKELMEKIVIKKQ